MSLPFALRLLESGLPPSVAVGREFFDALPPGHTHELDYALALCDSPEAAIRAYGHDYVRARLSTLPRDDLIHGLAESADPRMQELVAGLLMESADAAAESPGFDRQVLSKPDRGRRAKETVKRRLERDGPKDVALLLEMARSATGRDAEWALEQLARLALAGQEIEGFSVEGTAGV
jgi:hypothetical protein